MGEIRGTGQSRRTLERSLEGVVLNHQSLGVSSACGWLRESQENESGEKKHQLRQVVGRGSTEWGVDW